MRVRQIAGPNQTKVCSICGRDLPLKHIQKVQGCIVEEAFVKKCDRNLHNTPEARERRRLRRIERRNTVAGLREREKQTDLLRLQNNEDAYKKYIIRSAKRRALSQGIPF